MRIDSAWLKGWVLRAAMRWPIDGTITIKTHFGSTPDTGVFGKHAGTDMRAIIGTPVYAPIAGTVTDSFLGTTGNLVEITADGKSHRVLHLSGRNVKKGDTVKEGQLVGVSGTYGTGPHVHWDIRTAGTAYDHSFSDYFDPELLMKGEDVNPLKALIQDDETERQIIWLPICHRNPYPQEKGRYRGWEVGKAITDAEKNADRIQLDKLSKSYYDNGSKIPAAVEPQVEVNGVPYGPVK